MVNKITRHAPHENMFEESSGNSFVSPPENSLSDSKQSLGERLYPKVFAVTPEHAGKVTGMFLEWPAAEVQRLLHSDKVLKDKIQEALSCLNKAQSPGKGKAKAGTWHQTAHQTWADKAREGHKFQDSKAKGKGKDSSQRGTPRFAAQVNPCEWSEKPEVTTLPRIQKALTEGLVFPGNLIVTRDEEVAKEASNIFNAFGCQNQKLTVAVVGGQAKGPSICVWWSPSKSLNLPAQRIPARLFQIGSSNGPVLKPAAVVTNFPKPLGDKLVTIRFLSPAFYRKHIPGICQDDTPKSVIAAWAQMTGLQASTFTGGRWEIAKHGHGSILIGHVKMTKEQADKCLPLSGRNALFVTQVPLVDNKKAVAWIPRNSAPLEEYFRQAFTQAQARKAPLVLRQGGGSDLGLLGVEASELGNKFQTRMWELFGAPKHWSDVDVKAFVCQNSWCDVQVVNKIRRGPHFLWLFKARRADNQGEASENSWHYKDQDGNLFLSIGSARPRTRKQPVVEQLVAPKKRWVDTQPVLPAVAITQLDDLTAESPVSKSQEAKDNAENSAGERERSPRRGKGTATELKVPPKPLDPEKVFAALHKEWKVVDNGGAGDCAFRCIAYNLSLAQGVPLQGEALEREASRLRLIATGQLTKYSDKYKEFWAVDPHEKEFERDFQDIPQDFPAYIMAASRKGYYADDLILSALADRLRAPLIIFAWSPERQSWERSVLANSWNSDVAQTKGPKMVPVALMQHNNHYKSICGLDGHTEVPQAWLHRTEVKPKKFYRGGGNKKQLSLPSSLKRSNSGILSLPDSVQKSVKPCNKKAASVLSLPSSSKLSQQLRSVQKQSVSGKSLPPGSVCNQSVVTQDRTCRSTLPPGSKKGDGFCLSLPPGSESGKKRKAHVLEDTPQQELELSGPEISQDQTLWWQCSFPGCKYEVWRTPGTHHHTARRWTHLRYTHKVPVKDIPPVDRSSLVSEAQIRRKERTWEFMFPLLKKHGWNGMHLHPGKLTPTGSGFPSKCQACQQQLKKNLYSTLCSATVDTSKKTLTRPERTKKWVGWWKLAAKQAKQQAQKERLCQRKKSVTTAAHRKQRLWEHKNVAQRETGSIVKGIPCVPASETAIWWKCSWCDFTILHSERSSTKSLKRSNHLFRQHGIKAEKLPTGNPLSAPHRVHKCQDYFDQRWTLQFQRFQQLKWKGAHDIEEQPCFVRPYQTKHGKQLCNIYHKCKTCALPVIRQSLPLRVCPQFSGTATPLRRRKLLWSKCRQEASLTLSKKAGGVRGSKAQLSEAADGIGATRKGLRGCRIGEASNPGPRSRGVDPSHELRVMSTNKHWIMAYQWNRLVVRSR
jgi:hypothetical protein